ncbi:M28 family peptidase [Saccharospirillum impatiens]|uniref:M28 family peptidase n=1 Tax=Saccharospirillum impatiens TaxID=169438 RepID=UPI001FDF9180|nr:M28 family peptidase [Saccharospirillum impatiens]
MHRNECRVIRWATPMRLPRCMQAENIVPYLEEFQRLADENGGNRAAGLSGYDASVTFVANSLEDMGYNVTLDAFDFTAFYELGEGLLSSLAPTPTSYVWNEDVTYLSQTEPGNVSGTAQTVDLELGEGNASTSGCEIEDFDSFQSGNIALMQRGACSFQQKAENAATAGAVGAIIFNQGNAEDRQGLINATLGDEYSGGIPVFFATYENGVTWAETDGLVLSMLADVLRETRSVDNVIAESRWGNPNNVLMLGAHLDSVAEGPGINDNASGSAALLEMANLMQKARTRNKVRFAWWGAEEAGLVGSTRYVQNLDETELGRIKAYLNFDMIASPNFIYGIYDGGGSEFGLEGPAGSAAIESVFETYFELRGESFVDSEISFRSDYAQFFVEDIAFGGLFTGAEVIKTEEEASVFGGEAGVAYDECYHAACDTIENFDLRALEVNADAIAFVTSIFAQTTHLIDEQIEAAEAEPSIQTFMTKAVQYDITHWGKHWIK